MEEGVDSIEDNGEYSELERKVGTAAGIAAAVISYTVGIVYADQGLGPLAGLCAAGPAVISSFAAAEITKYFRSS